MKRTACVRLPYAACFSASKMNRPSHTDSHKDATHTCWCQSERWWNGADKKQLCCSSVRNKDESGDGCGPGRIHLPSITLCEMFPIPVGQWRLLVSCPCPSLARCVKGTSEWSSFMGPSITRAGYFMYCHGNEAASAVNCRLVWMDWGLAKLHTGLLSSLQGPLSYQTCGL